MLRLTYHAYRRPEAEQRRIEPISLIFMSESWHLAAYCRVRQAPRFFRLDRIDTLDVLHERYEVDQRHAVPEHRDEWRSTRPEARVRFDTESERPSRSSRLSCGSMGDSFSQFTTREGTMWALMQRPEHSTPLGAELYLQVDDVDAAYRTWRERGVETLGEPQNEPFGCVFAFKDPDGRVLYAWAPAS